MLLSWVLSVCAYSVVIAALVHIVPFVCQIMIATWRLRKLPLPTVKGNFLTGHSFRLVNWFRDPPNIHLGDHIMQTLEGMCHLHRKLGIIRLDLGLVAPVVLLFKASLIETVLKSPRELKKSPEYRLTGPFFGNALIPSSPDLWRKRRPLLKSAFPPRVLSSFQSIFSRSSQRMVDQFAAHVDEEINNLPVYFGYVGLDVICGTLFGHDIGDYSSKEHPISKCTALVTGTFATRITRPWWWMYYMFRTLSSEGRISHQNLLEMDCFALKLIETAQSHLANSIDSTEYLGRRSYFDLLLRHNATCQSNDTIMDAELLDHARTSIIAGTDAILWSLVWATYLLGRNPEAQEKAWREVDGIFQGDKDRPITDQDLARLKYVEAVVKESSRLISVAPAMSRQLEHDLLIGDHLIPKHTNVILMLKTLHQDPDVFPDPEKFDPERFLNGNIPYCGYLPFSEGPRKCLGFRFATIAMKTVLCNQLRHFRWTSLDPLDYVQPSWSHLLLYPAKPIRVRFESRGMSVQLN